MHRSPPQYLIIDCHVTNYTNKTQLMSNEVHISMRDGRRDLCWKFEYEDYVGG